MATSQTISPLGIHSKKPFNITALVEQAIGLKVWVLMKNDKELIGTLRGFDEFLSIIPSTI
jgi:small nuclear ribonucleoprotein (snRNP)-like protein